MEGFAQILSSEALSSKSCTFLHPRTPVNGCPSAQTTKPPEYVVPPTDLRWFYFYYPCNAPHHCLDCSVSCGDNTDPIWILAALGVPSIVFPTGSVAPVHRLPKSSLKAVDLQNCQFPSISSSNGYLKTRRLAAVTLSFGGADLRPPRNLLNHAEVFRATLKGLSRKMSAGSSLQRLSGTEAG